MTKMLKAMSFVAALGFASHASAGLLIEPYLGYASATLEAKSTGADSGGKTTGMGLGLRAGYKLPVMLWFALDYSMLSGATFAGNNSGNDGKVDTSDLYLDVGFDLPILARVWAGYGLQSKSKVKYDVGPSADVTFESPIKVGIGFTALPIVSINVEYFMSKIKDVESNGVTVNGSSFDSNSNTGFMVSVSAPFNL